MSVAFDRRVTPARPDLAAASLRGKVQAERFVEGVRHAVAAPAVPLRREPRDDCGLDTELVHGEVFTLYEVTDEGWGWGQAEADGYVGWLPSALLGPMDPPAPTHRVAALRTFLYPAPSIKQPALLALPFGSRLVVTAREGAFARVADGWVWAGHLSETASVDADPVAVAAMFLGTPYLWGGKTSLGLDCSALVQTALRACGLVAPRDSDMQERALGEAIDPDGELRRGDLVFWRGHVALMADATTMLHANGHTMSVGWEALDAARRRIAASGGGPVTSVRRLTEVASRTL